MRVLLALCVAAAVAAVPAWAATITVNSTADDSDNDGECTLREAIIAANTNTVSGASAGECAAGAAFPTVDQIHFSIGGAGPHTINTATGMPTVSETAIIDGRTEPDYSYPGPEVYVNFTGGAGDYAGIVLDDGGCAVHALGVTNFPAEGILIATSEGGCTITECYLGLAADGTTPAGNKQGVRISNSPNNIIGSATPDHANRISGNGATGPPYGSGVEIYNSTSTGNVVIGNYIGTNASGTAAVGNGHGVAILAGATGNTIGGTAAAARNIISGNVQNGISIDDSDGNFIYGNYIGLAANGQTSLGNGGAGVSLFSDADSNVIGSSTSGARNFISGNSGPGVSVFSNCDDTIVRNNHIGVATLAVTTAVPNAWGVMLGQGSLRTAIGGTGTDEGNLISGNNEDGIQIGGGAANTTVRGNRIGTNAAGDGSVPNVLNGIEIMQTNYCTIGGAAAGSGNVISGNGTNGVLLSNGALGNSISGNRIGTNAAGTGPLGNTAHGVLVEGSPDNFIGGTSPGEGNTIAFNGEDGVAVLGSPPACIQKAIWRNSMHDNAGLGIDLGDDGVTANDVGDPDPGPNNLQNFPVLSSVETGAGQITISGSLNSLAGTYRIEFFSSPDCDPSGYGEGATYLGDTNVLIAGTSADFNVTLPVSVSPGHVITATATDLDGNTSEFSQCLALAAPEPIPALTFAGLAALALLLAAAAAWTLRSRG